MRFEKICFSLLLGLSLLGAGARAQESDTLMDLPLTPGTVVGALPSTPPPSPIRPPTPRPFPPRIKGMSATITNSHYLQNSTCPIEAGVEGYVGGGSRVIVLKSEHQAAGLYPDAVLIRVINNTDDSAIAASNGCEGWALAGYVALDPEPVQISR